MIWKSWLHPYRAQSDEGFPGVRIGHASIAHELLFWFSVLQTPATLRRLRAAHAPFPVIFLISRSRILRRAFAGCGVMLHLMVTGASAGPDLDPSVVLPEKIFPILIPILETAARQGPQALRARLDEQMAEEMILVARSRRLPSVGGGGTFSIAQEKRLDRPDLAAAEKLTYNFGLTQPVYHWGSLRAGHEVGKISARIAENNYAEACRLLLIEVRGLYLRMVVARAEVERTRNVLRLGREDLATAESRIQSGALAPGEIHSVRFRVLDAEIGFEKAEEEFRFAKATLERLAGIAPLSESDVPSLVPNVPFDPALIASFLESYLGRNGAESDFRATALKLQWEQEKLNAQITAKNLWPKLNFVTGTTQDEVSYTGSPADRGQIRSFYAGVNLTWNLFDGFSTKGYRRASLIRQRQLEGDRTARMREQIDRARNQAKMLELAARQTAVSESRLSQLDGLVAHQEKEVSLGNMARRDAEGWILTRDEALLRTMVLRIEYLSRLTEFLSIIGRDPVLKQILSQSP